ncbi:MAG: 30S ribosomal protein S17 [Parcubacteria group bacterium]
MTTDTKIIRTFSGKVIGTKMAKTAVVLVERTMRHPKYHKQYKQSTKFKIHDPKKECHVGDTVIFQECRPISRDKRWRFIKKAE